MINWYRNYICHYLGVFFRGVRAMFDKFEKLIGGGHFGTVRLANRISDPNIKYAVKSILRQNIKKDVKLLEEELEILR